mgnify:CR=1 FL=1
MFALAAKAKTPAKTPKKTVPAKTPKTAIKKSVKKRTWADIAKKTPAAKPKAAAASKAMAAHLTKQNRRLSGRALPTFSMTVPKSLDFSSGSGHALESPAIAISKKKNKTPVLIKTKKGRKTPFKVAPATKKSGKETNFQGLAEMMKTPAKALKKAKAETPKSAKKSPAKLATPKNVKKSPVKAVTPKSAKKTPAKAATPKSAKKATPAKKSPAKKASAKKTSVKKTSATPEERNKERNKFFYTVKYSPFQL